MNKDRRRKGDARPLNHDRAIPLSWWPTAVRPLRWLPRHGQPYCIAEWFSQTFVKFVANVAVYTFIVVVLILLVQILHPYGLGK